MQRKLYPWLLALLVLVMASCSKDENITTVKGRYDNGFFLLNEGSWGNETGSVHFYSYDTDSLYLYVYEKENTGTGDTLGTNKQVLEFGTIYNNKLYLVVNLGGPLVVTDASTLKETGRINNLPDRAHAFVGVDNTRGLISTVNGIYPVNLSSLTTGTKISGIDGSVTDMIKAGNYIFVLSANNGIVALNAGDYSVAKVIGAATTGFAIGKDGSVWAATVNSLLKINASTLAVDTINTSFDVYFNEYNYNSGSIVASTTENAVYVTSAYTMVYKYIVGNAASLTTPFITLPANHYLFGKGIAYNEKKGELVLNTTNDIYGGTVNTIYSYNATTGAEGNNFIYNGKYYPAMAVFH
ncbi:protein of unknown function [Chitinophaga sp. CF118]|uniref:DUF5074 domain-containing protein n=1 Tax=Chitinophaga sp. CF118 TaxID=1884367 RepID=UPI0008E166A0|nr:DUF5074 domain-containing protein [Chitinophaga sp. CF118]SFE51414.1 protein of unknown function [Chitinophaga sp. CF118]